MSAAPFTPVASVTHVDEFEVNGQTEAVVVQQNTAYAHTESSGSFGGWSNPWRVIVSIIVVILIIIAIVMVARTEYPMNGMASGTRKGALIVAILALGALILLFINYRQPVLLV